MIQRVVGTHMNTKHSIQGGGEWPEIVTIPQHLDHAPRVLQEASMGIPMGELLAMVPF